MNRSIIGNGTITATGTLFMGDANSTGGYAFGGTLNVASNIVSLADADTAQLGVVTTLGNLGRLDAINGMMLGSGSTISASAIAAISGALVNNGTVNGPTAPANRSRCSATPAAPATTRATSTSPRGSAPG